jgi:hypothetical protein
MAVDKKEIAELLHANFTVAGKVSISDTGLVSVHGNVWLLKNCEKFPVSFDRIHGDFRCGEKELETLEGGPRWVSGRLNCFGNQLKSLVGSPAWVGHDFVCDVNPLVSLEGIPMYIGRELWCPFTSNLPLCQILTSRMKEVYIDGPGDVSQIVRKYLNAGYQGMFSFAAELIRAGYGDNAWL